MASEDQSPNSTEFQESAVKTKWNIRLFWMILAVLVFNAGVAFRFNGQMPNLIALGFGNLVVLLVVNVRLGQRRRTRVEGRIFEGDGGPLRATLERIRAITAFIQRFGIPLR